MKKLICPRCLSKLSEKQIKSLYGQLMVGRRKTVKAGPGRGHRKQQKGSDGLPA